MQLLALVEQDFMVARVGKLLITFSKALLLFIFYFILLYFVKELNNAISNVIQRTTYHQLRVFKMLRNPLSCSHEQLVRSSSRCYLNMLSLRTCLL